MTCAKRWINLCKWGRYDLSRKRKKIQNTDKNMKKIKVLSVNISQKKGTIKHAVPSITLTRNGVEGDAHSGPWNRQVSMLGIESIRKFEQEVQRKIGYGEFAENITTEGLELWKCQPLDRFVSDDIELEVTQIGKECHGTSCSIFKEVGNCVMPKEGIFARVVGTGLRAQGSGLRAQGSGHRVQGSGLREQGTGHPGSLTAGMNLIYHPKIFSVRIITLSDRAFHGEYEDRSGPRIAELLTLYFQSHKASAMSHEAQDLKHGQNKYPDLQPSSLDTESHVSRHTSHIILLPDDPDQLRTVLKESIADGTDFIFTTGGTGIGPRDFTPDVVKPLLDKEVPGIMEGIRMKYGADKPQALLSRSVAGVAGNTLLFTLPGSVRAVDEYMNEILKSLMHLKYMIHSLDMHG